MNKVVVEGKVAFVDGAWLTISIGKDDVHCYVPGNIKVFENDYVRIEGYLIATHLDANRFVATSIEKICKA